MPVGVGAFDLKSAQGDGRAQVEPMPFAPVLTGVLLSGGTPRYLRHGLIAAAEAKSEVSIESPWWPRANIVGRQIAPYLATHVEWAHP